VARESLLCGIPAREGKSDTLFYSVKIFLLRSASGEYLCSAVNVHGALEVAVEVDVQYPPACKQEPIFRCSYPLFFLDKSILGHVTKRSDESMFRARK